MLWSLEILACTHVITSPFCTSEKFITRGLTTVCSIPSPSLPPCPCPQENALPKM